MKQWIRDKIISFSKTHIWLENVLKLYRAYKLYAQIRLILGSECTLCSCAPIGTGDYYFCGLYMRHWLEQNHFQNWVMLCENETVRKVTDLFPLFNQHTYIPKETDTINNMRKILPFCRNTNYHYFHYMHSHMEHAGIMRIFPTPTELFGYKGLEMIDLYLYGAWFLLRDIKPNLPVFSECDINDIVYCQNICLEKTIIISPYATSYREHLPPLSLWVDMVKILREYGFIVFTNCVRREKAIDGTRKLVLPYNVSVPLLNQMAGFIGIRSGLCDIISTATCKKVILHPHGSRNWPYGSSVSFTGLNHMGLCKDAVELSFEPCWANLNDVLEKVLEQFML